METLVKNCKKCKISQPLENFNKSLRHKYGKNIYCKTCVNKNTRLYYAKTVDKRKEYSQKYEKERRDRPKDHNTKKKNSRMFLIYGITDVDYKEMLMNQGGVCKVCKGPPNVLGQKRMAIDHNHKTGEVRGLICMICNVMLGHAKDSIQILTSAIEYLKSEPTKFRYGRKKKYKKEAV
jgi:hypothetical protein